MLDVVDIHACRYSGCTRATLRNSLLCVRGHCISHQLIGTICTPGKKKKKKNTQGKFQQTSHALKPGHINKADLFARKPPVSFPRDSPSLSCSFPPYKDLKISSSSYSSSCSCKPKLLHPVLIKVTRSRLGLNSQ